MDEELIGEIIVRYSLDIKSLRVFDNEITPCSFKMKCEIIQDPDSDEVSSLDIKITLTKIKFFFEEIFSDGLIWCVDNDWANDVFFDDDGDCTLGNIPIITPQEPTDDHLAILLQAKMNAFAPEGMQFNFVELIPIDNDISFLFVGDAAEALPTMEEWIGDRAYFDSPWWCRGDCSTTDIIPDEDSDLDDKPDYSMDFITEHLMPQPEAKSGKIIRPEFRPKIIKGGLDEPEN